LQMWARSHSPRELDPSPAKVSRGQHERVERMGWLNESSVRVNFNKAKFMSEDRARHVFMNDMRAMILKRAVATTSIQTTLSRRHEHSAKPRTVEVCSDVYQRT
jgi:hypothetical protein